MTSTKYLITTGMPFLDKSSFAFIFSFWFTESYTKILQSHHETFLNGTKLTDFLDPYNKSHYKYPKAENEASLIICDFICLRVICYTMLGLFSAPVLQYLHLRIRFFKLRDINPWGTSDISFGQSVLPL